jgi:inner membrane protease ATP23
MSTRPANNRLALVFISCTLNHTTFSFFFLSTFVFPAQIILCANRKLPREETAVENIVHEMIHAFDNCRAKVDWSNPVHRACSEIRAANLSGDCHWIREYERYRYRKEWMMPMLKQQQACVRRRAILSVKEMPGMTEEAAAAAVDTAWQTCYQDHAPFERPP